jgi:hypothetical protein
MPTMALPRVAARVVGSGPGGENLATGTWRRLEALPDSRSRQGRVYPLACLVAVSGSGGPARQTWPACALRGIRSRCR